MGGRVLEFTGEKLYKEGIKAGALRNLVEVVYEGLLGEDTAAEWAEKKYDVPAEEFKKRLAEYHPDEEQMQG